MTSTCFRRVRLVVDADDTLLGGRQSGQSFANARWVAGAQFSLRLLQEVADLEVLTSAGMLSEKGNAAAAERKHRPYLQRKMESEKLELPINFGKPSGDLYLDDRAVRFTNWSSRALAAICASCCVPVPRATHRPTDVIITAGGQGSRMGTALPKPLVEVCPGTPMAEHALISLSGLTINTLIIVSNCVADAEHNLGGRIADLAHKHQQQGLYSFDKIVCATEEGQPRGQLTTALCARAHLSNHHGVMILPVDGLVDWRPAQAIAELQLGDTGFLTVIPMQGERWTFARTDEDGVILQVAEKVRISDLAGTGIYFFSDSCQFLYESERTVARGPSPHQEYFVTPMIQEMIRNGARFRAVLVDDFWEFGTRESLLRYGREISRRFITG